MTKDFPYRMLPKGKLFKVECFICHKIFWWAYMTRILEPLDKRKKKYGICPVCDIEFEKIMKRNGMINWLLE